MSAKRRRPTKSSDPEEPEITDGPIPASPIPVSFDPDPAFDIDRTPEPPAKAADREPEVRTPPAPNPEPIAESEPEPEQLSENLYADPVDRARRRLLRDVERAGTFGHGLDSDRRLLRDAASLIRSLMGLAPDESLDY